MSTLAPARILHHIDRATHQMLWEQIKPQLLAVRQARHRRSATGRPSWDEALDWSRFGYLDQLSVEGDDWYVTMYRANASGERDRILIPTMFVEATPAEARHRAYALLDAHECIVASDAAKPATNTPLRPSSSTFPAFEPLTKHTLHKLFWNELKPQRQEVRDVLRSLGLLHGISVSREIPADLHWVFVGYRSKITIEGDTWYIEPLGQGPGYRREVPKKFIKTSLDEIRVVTHESLRVHREHVKRHARNLDQMRLARQQQLAADLEELRLRRVQDLEHKIAELRVA